MKILHFGKYRGRTLDRVPSRYLLFMATRHTLGADVLRAFLDELAGRLMADDAAVLAELLTPPSPEELAAAAARKWERENRRLMAALQRRREEWAR